MVVAPGRLHLFIAAALGDLDVPEQDAATVALSLVQAELEGQSGHGAIRLPFLLGRLKAGLINSRPQMRVLSERPAAAVLDGGNGLGPVVGVKALELAMTMARATGVGVCAVQRSNHLGAVGFYVNLAASEGLIALALGNTPPAMAPPGGRAAFLGTNPLAAAFPTLDAPVVVDMATSQVARGRLMKAARAGQAIPTGWGLDAAGRDTTDATAALAGTMVPLGGAKGFALALVVEALSGVLAGSAVGPAVGGTIAASDRESDVGHCFIVLDPEAFGGGFAERMAALADQIRAVEPLDPAAPVRLPGDRRRKEAEQRRAAGIELPDGLVAELEEATGRTL